MRGYRGVNNKKVRYKNIIAYGLGDLYGGGAFLIIGTLFLIFLTDIVGLSPARAGLILIIGKSWDAISDPIMGYLSDHTKTKYGRRRIYFLIAIIPIAISFILLWAPVNFSSNRLLFYYYLFAYIFFSTVFTMVMVPYSALNAEISENYKTRTKLSTSRMLFSQFSALLAGVLPKIIINQFPIEKQGYFIMSIIFAILYALPWIIVFKGTWELPYKNLNKSKRLNLNSFKTVFVNKSFRIHIGMYLSAYVAMDFLMALFIYFLNYYLQKENLFPYTMLALLLSQIIMLPIYMKISNKYGKGKAYRIGLSIWGSAMIFSFLLSPSSSILSIIIISIFMGIGLSAGVMVPWAVLPSIADIDELISKEKRTGIYSGLMTLIRKLAQAIALWITGLLLSLIHYIPNQTQSTDTLFKLRLIFILIPLSLIIIGLFFASKFKITPEKHKILIQEINRIKAGGKKKDVKDKVRIICEELTGLPYK